MAPVPVPPSKGGTGVSLYSKAGSPSDHLYSSDAYGFLNIPVTPTRSLITTSGSLEIENVFFGVIWVISH